jgi:hypothetical protein
MQSWDAATAKFFLLLALVRAREVLPRSPFRPQSGDRLALKVVLVRALWTDQWCRSNLSRYPRLFGPTRLQKLELLLDARLLLLAPRYETIRRCHFCSGVLVLFPNQRGSKPEVACRLKADVRLWHEAD